jgi:hypothetical protein
VLLRKTTIENVSAAAAASRASLLISHRLGRCQKSMLFLMLLLLLQCT